MSVRMRVHVCLCVSVCLPIYVSACCGCVLCQFALVCMYSSQGTAVVVVLVLRRGGKGKGGTTTGDKQTERKYHMRCGDFIGRVLKRPAHSV